MPKKRLPAELLVEGIGAGTAAQSWKKIDPADPHGGGKRGVIVVLLVALVDHHLLDETL